MRVDLSFADVVVSPEGRLTFYGKRGSTIRVDGARKELPPVKEGEIRLPLERFLEALGSMLFASLEMMAQRTGEEKKEEAKAEAEVETGAKKEGEGEAETSEASGQEMVVQGETTEEGNGDRTEGDETLGEEKGVGAKEEDGRGEISRPEIFRFRGRDGFSVILFPARNGVWFSIAKRKENEIVEKSAGLVRPSRALVLAEAIGASLHEGKLLRALAGAILLAEKGDVSFMDGSSGTTLTGTQKRELFNLISAKFMGANGRLAFRAGRVRIREDTNGNFLLRMGRNEGKLTPGDLMILRSVCL